VGVAQVRTETDQGLPVPTVIISSTRSANFFDRKAPLARRHM
jgi:hypothetical protein